MNRGLQDVKRHLFIKLFYLLYFILFNYLYSVFLLFIFSFLLMNENEILPSVFIHIILYGNITAFCLRPYSLYMIKT